MSWYRWYPEVLKKYAVFGGRAHRREYWFFTLINLLIYIALVLVEDQRVLATIYSLAVLIPSIAVAVRRLHDTGRSGWWVLLGLVPILNIVLIVFLALDGQRGPNEYGPDPKGEEFAFESGRTPPPDAPPPPPAPPEQGVPTGGFPGQDPALPLPPPSTPSSDAPPAMPSPPPETGPEQPRQ